MDFLALHLHHFTDSKAQLYINVLNSHRSTDIGRLHQRRQRYGRLSLVDRLLQNRQVLSFFVKEDIAYIAVTSLLLHWNHLYLLKCIIFVILMFNGASITFAAISFSYASPIR